MRRREFIVALAGTVSLGWIAFAESANKARIVGWLGPAAPNDPGAVKARASFDREIGNLGWEVGQNLRIERRAANGDPDRANEFAEELVALKPDVIVAPSSLSPRSRG